MTTFTTRIPQADDHIADAFQAATIAFGAILGLLTVLTTI